MSEENKLNTPKIQPEEQEAPVTLPLADLSYVRRYVTVEF